jgi:radical SAM superfamily enzyme YgiQ (UPF0313 family)
MADIVLATLNARWSHASLGLRCLYANLGPLQSRAAIEEFTVAAPLEPVVERILAHEPRVLGLGVYIWNVTRTTELVRRLRAAAPRLRIVLGGPEVSHELDSQPIVALADHVVTGPGEWAFARLAAQLLDGPRPLSRIVAGGLPPLEEIALPYAHYTAEDLARRHLYVEASRGCPFRCEFCLSSLDRTAVPFPLPALLQSLADLHARGARAFRFVDRTFNLKAAVGRTILEFFLERLREMPGEPLFLHFELVPDHLPDVLREPIVQFPPGTLQFEIGIQTWNPEVQTRISRRQDNAKAEANLRWLRSETHAHLHVDLIAGLPGESLESFAEGFDRLVRLRPQEVQVGLLKRLRGAPIARHTGPFGMRYATDAPYQVLETAALSAADVTRIARFARYWDLYANSGRFARTLPMQLGDAPFERFMALSDWLWARTGSTHRLSLEQRADALRAWLVECDRRDPTTVEHAIAADYAASGARGRLPFSARGLAGSPTCDPARDPTRDRASDPAIERTRNDAQAPPLLPVATRPPRATRGAVRQSRHLAR